MTLSPRTIARSILRWDWLSCVSSAARRTRFMWGSNPSRIPRYPRPPFSSTITFELIRWLRRESGLIIGPRRSHGGGVLKGLRERRRCEPTSFVLVTEPNMKRRYVRRRRRWSTNHNAGIAAKTIRRAIVPRGRRNEFCWTGACSEVQPREKFPGPPAVSATRVTKFEVDQGKSNVFESPGVNTASSPRAISSLYTKTCTLGTDALSNEMVRRLSALGARAATSR